MENEKVVIDGNQGENEYDQIQGTKENAGSKKHKRRVKKNKSSKPRHVSKLSVFAKVSIPFIILGILVSTSLFAMNKSIKEAERNSDILSTNMMECQRSVGDMQYCYTLANSMVDSAAGNLSLAANYQVAMEEQFKKLTEAAEVYKANALTDKEREYADKLVEFSNTALEAREEKFSYYLKGEVPDKSVLTVKDSNSDVLGMIATMRNATSEDVGLIQNELTESYRRVNASVIGAIVAVAIGFIIGIIIILNSVVNPIKKSSKELDKMVSEVNNSEGDLTKRITIYQQDEVGKLVVGVNTFIESLQGIISGIRGSANDLDASFSNVTNSVSMVNDSANDISAVMEELSATMQEVAASLANVNATVEGAGSEMDGINDKSMAILEYAGEMKSRAEDLEQTAVSNKNTTEVMINEILGSLETAIENSKSVEEVNALTDDILSISSQTNLLALNASIEAARAGEAGKGFAVVADEIRNLADSSRETANNIQEINEKVVAAVSDLSANSEKIIEYINENIMKDYDGFVDSGHQYSADSEYINNIMIDFSHAVADLKNTMNEVVTKINDVSTAVDQGANGVASAAENTSDLVGELYSISNEMEESNKIVGELNQNTNKFTNV